MTKPNSPWSIKGVSAEARYAAKEGARISRQPLGKWLGQVIRKISADEADGLGTGPLSGGGDAAPNGAGAASPTSAATWQEAVVRLEARIADTEGRAATAVRSMNEALNRIADRLDSMETYVLRRPRRSYLGRLFRR